MKPTRFIFLFLISYFFFNTFNQAQSPFWLWSRSAGGTTYDVANSVSADLAGNTIATGYFNGASITFGADVLLNANLDTSNVFIVKYDPAGNPVWARGAGGTGHDRGTAVATDASGNIYVTGYFESATITFDTITLNNLSMYSDMFLAKYDAAGNIVWAKSAGSMYNDGANAIAVDDAGNILVAGYFQAASMSFDTTTINNQGNFDMFVVKYSSSGNVLWVDGRGGNNEEKAYAITTDGSNNVVVSGAFLSSSVLFDVDTINYSGGAYTDIFTVKYTSAGNVSWANCEGGTYLDEPNAAVMDINGNTYIAGIYYSSSIPFGTDTLSNSGSSFYGDMFIAKYDVNGNNVWAKRAGAGTNNDWATALDMDIAGNVWVSGVFGSTISFDSFTLTNEAMFLVQFDANGTALYATDVAGGMAYGMSIDILDNIHIAGIVYDPTITFGSNPVLNSNGFYDVIVAKHGTTAGIWTCCDPLDMVVYPNPTSDEIILSSPENEIITLLEIYNIHGEKVLLRQAYDQYLVTDVSTFAPGIYFLVMETTERRLIKKIIKR